MGTVCSLSPRNPLVDLCMLELDKAIKLFERASSNQVPPHGVRKNLEWLRWIRQCYRYQLKIQSQSFSEAFTASNLLDIVQADDEEPINPSGVGGPTSYLDLVGWGTRLIKLGETQGCGGPAHEPSVILEETPMGGFGPRPPGSLGAQPMSSSSGIATSVSDPLQQIDHVLPPFDVSGLDFVSSVKTSLPVPVAVPLTNYTVGTSLWVRRATLGNCLRSDTDYISPTSFACDARKHLDLDAPSYSGLMSCRSKCFCVTLH